MTMGEKILKMRKARSWNQEELAERVGVTRQAVSRWEACSAKPDADKIIALCDLFGVSADYLLREDYAGEASASHPVEAEKEKRAPVLTSQQILGIVLLVMGFVMTFFLCIMSVLKPHTVYTGYYVYSGFLGFIVGNQLEWFLAALVIMILSGFLLFLQNKPFLKLLGRLRDFFSRYQ
ncbi:MAG: helix-turn-helix transcriptional regulator [Oscillospiraceae bacterium]|nr:helix-turn-helix transcriptional regulator [Oscillospiraceae bacterium]